MRLSYIKSRLDGLEANLQGIIEGLAAHLLLPEGEFEELAHQLVGALRSGLKVMTVDEIVAPNYFILYLNPILAGKLRSHPEVLQELSTALRTTVADNGARLLGPLTLFVKDAQEAPLRFIQVQAIISPEMISQTSDLTPDEKAVAVSLPDKAFLIVNGTQIFPLDRSVVNIGRRPDNQLVIDDARVSRLHAQLRAIRGRYVIFDLESTGGTFVNEHRVHQCVLHPGDVISLAGVPLVYGQDSTSPGETQRLEPHG